MTLFSLRRVCFAIVLAPSSVLAELIEDFYPLVYDTSMPHVLTLVDVDVPEYRNINVRTPLLLSQALQEFPQIIELRLSSRGGHVHSALNMAYEVRKAGLRTVIPEGDLCQSACSYVFFAGVDRHAHGKLGVHRLASRSNDLQAGMDVLRDITSAFDDFGVDGKVITHMLRTPHDRFYYFEADELNELQINHADACAGAESHLARVFPMGSEGLHAHLQSFADCPTAHRADRRLAALAAASDVDGNDTPQETAEFRRCTQADGWEQVLLVCRAALTSSDWTEADRAALHNAIGAAFLETGDAFAAHEAFQEALALLPETQAFLENRSLALTALGQQGSAADVLRAAIAASAAPPQRLFVRLGMAERSAGNVNTAFQIWDDLLSDAETETSQIRLWQEALAEAGLFDQPAGGRYTELTRVAVQNCSYRSDCQPPGADAPPRLLPVPVAEVPLNLSRDEATRRLIDLSAPDGEGSCIQGQPEMNIYLCLAMLQEGKFEDRERAEIENLLARQYLSIEAYDDAEAAITRAIALVPPKQMYFENRASIRYRNGDFEGALQDLDAIAAMRARRNDRIDHYKRQLDLHRGNVLARLGRAEEAVASWNAALIREGLAIPADTARDLQRLLQEKGHYTGAIDGRFGPNSRRALIACAATSDCVLDGALGPQRFYEITDFQIHGDHPSGPLYFDEARRENAKAAMAECNMWQGKVTVRNCTLAIETGWLIKSEMADAYLRRSYEQEDPRKELADYFDYMRAVGFQNYDEEEYVRLLIKGDKPEIALNELDGLRGLDEYKEDFYRGLALAALGRNDEAERTWLSDYDRVDDDVSVETGTWGAWGYSVLPLYINHLDSRGHLPSGYGHNVSQVGKTPALRAAIASCASDPSCFTLN